MARQKISSIIFKGIIISLIFCFPEILQAKNIDIGSSGDSVRIFGTSFCLGDTNCISTWNDISGSWTRNGTSIYYNNGLVGIGITNPTAALDVYRTEPFRTRGQVVFGGSAYIGSGTRLLTVDNVGNVIAAPIASTVGLPTSATAGQTLRYNGTSWVANPALYSNGTNVGVGTSN
ncbi:MAG: hypothetical protein PWQ35_647, partial [Patescibacteria group bacterium]|nr:hypothetical protein [Patescibacteria group bacterium]